MNRPKHALLILLCLAAAATLHAQEARKLDGRATLQQGVAEQRRALEVPAATTAPTTATPGAANAAPADSGERRAALQRAEAAYKLAATDAASRGPALHNLATLAAREGRDAEARQYFEQAIAADDTRKGFYALNYARYLQDRDPPAALRAARVAVTAAPDSELANVQLGALLWRHAPAQMLPLARDLARRGRTELATRFALQCLRSQSRPDAERIGWLTLLARRAADEYPIASDATRAQLRADLANIEGDPVVGRGVAQLRAVLVAPPADRAGIDWWLAQREPQDGERTGSEAMRLFLLAAGEARAGTDRMAAERYFERAIELGERGPDPEAFLRLVELYATSQAREPLARLMERYQWELFSEKSEAYARGDWPLIYRMHIALGMTYAYLQVWTSSSPFQNAVFQLENAQRAAVQLNAQAERERSDTRVALPTRALKALADGYRAIGQATRVQRAVLDGAEQLRRVGQPADSVDALAILTPLDVQAMDAATRTRYQALRTQR